MSVSSPIDQQRFEQVRRLTEISRALTYTTSLDQVLHLAVDRAVELLSADQAILMLTGPDGLLHVRAARGVDEQRLDQFREPLDEALVHRLQGLVGNIAEDSFMGVPLVVHGEVTGLLAVVRQEGVYGTEAEELLLSALADQAAVALENARLTEEVQQELETREHAIQGSEARDKALTTLSHDLRTPLTAIDSYAELIEIGVYGAVTDRQLEALGRIRMSGRHLLSVLENVMEMARLSAGAIEMEARDVAIGEVVRDAVGIVKPGADAKEQRLTVEVPTDVVIHADAGRLRQVMVNLLGNAIKYSPRQGAIRVETSVATRNGKRSADISVSDSGAGIPQHMLETIFEPYVRVRATEAEPGVGLGLAISRELMRLMGGDITASSEEGKGSTFTAWLPLT